MSKKWFYIVGGLTILFLFLVLQHNNAIANHSVDRIEVRTNETSGQIIADVGATALPFWVTGTGSMEPIMTEGSHLTVVDREPVVGDIITYKASWYGGNVTHRVIHVGFDAGGWYGLAQGDQNEYIDPVIIRRGSIHGVVVNIFGPWREE